MIRRHAHSPPTPAGPAAAALTAQVFDLLSSARWLDRPSYRRWRAHFRAGRCRPPGRLSFWARLLQTAGLLGGGPLPAPTLALPAWLEEPPLQQAGGLLRAWVAMPRTPRVRRARARLLERLAQPHLAFQPWELRELNSLRLLGMWDGRRLTPLGMAALAPGPLPAPAAQPSPAWQVDVLELRAARPPNFSALWDLEAFLQPYLPGRYLLTGPALRLAASRGDPHELREIIQRGAGLPLTTDVARRILQQPQTRLLRGCVLEFSSPEELARLRAAARPGGALARALDGLLSPRHVFLEESGITAAARALAAQGIFVESSLPAPPAPSSLLLDDLAELYRLALEAHADPGLLRRLALLLPDPARRRIQRQVAPTAPRAVAPPALNEPDPPPLWRIAELRRLAALQESITILYRAPGSAKAQRRRVQPLLVEQRGARYYLVAYCHARRAQRSFRIDRLSIENER